MKTFSGMGQNWGPLLWVLCVQVCLAGVVGAQFVATNDPPQYGPYNNLFLQGGDGLRANLEEKDTVLRADSPWTMYCWVKPDEEVKGPTLLAGLGEVTEECRVPGDGGKRDGADWVAGVECGGEGGEGGRGEINEGRVGRSRGGLRDRW